MARITVNALDRIGRISPLIYGTMLENWGEQGRHAIYGYGLRVVARWWRAATKRFFALSTCFRVAQSLFKPDSVGTWIQPIAQECHAAFRY